MVGSATKGAKRGDRLGLRPMGASTSKGWGGVPLVIVLFLKAIAGATKNESVQGAADSEGQIAAWATGAGVG
jgi:hypothetical protein